VVLSFPRFLIAEQSPLPEGVSRVVLEDLSEDCLKQQLAAITATYGSIGAFIHLHPSFPISGGVSFLEADKVIIKQIFLMAKHLKESLNQVSCQGNSCFLTVARLDGAFGLQQSVKFSPISAGLFGLAKSLNFEWKSVYCRALDLSPDFNAEQSVQAIIAELHDPNRNLTEVGYGSHGRTTMRV
jgi:hypothetical protein